MKPFFRASPAEAAGTEIQPTEVRRPDFPQSVQ